MLNFKRKQVKIEPIVNGLFQEVLIANDSGSNPDLNQTFQQLNLSNKVEYSIVKGILYKYYAILGPEYWRKIVAFLKENNFNTITTDYLSKPNLSVKMIVSAIDSMTMMNEMLSGEVIERYMLTKNHKIISVVRENLIKTGGVEKLHLVFDNLQTLSRLDAVEMFESLKKIKTNGQFNYYTYLKKENTLHLNSLLLDLTVELQEYNAVSTLIDLYHSDDIPLKKKVINAMGKLMLFDVEDRLIEDFYLFDDSVKIEILKALGRISSGKSVELLLSVFETADQSIDVRIHAYRSLYALKSLIGDTMGDLEARSTGENRKIINFVKNPLVKYI